MRPTSEAGAPARQERQERRRSHAEVSLTPWGSMGDGPVTALCVSPNGRRVIAGAESGAVMVWETATRRLLGHLEVKAPVESIDISRKGGVVALGCRTFGPLVWDIARGEYAWLSDAHSGSGTTVGWSSDGSRLYVGWSDGVRVVTWPERTVAAEHLFERRPRLGLEREEACGLLADQDLAVSVARDGQMVMWKVTGAKVVHRLGMEEGSECLSAQIAGRRLLVSDRRFDFGGNGNRNRLEVFDLRDGTRLAALNRASDAVWLAPDGQRVVLVDATARDRRPGVLIWELASGELSPIAAPGLEDFGSITAVAPFRDGALLGGQRGQLLELTGLRTILRRAPARPAPRAKRAAAWSSPRPPRAKAARELVVHFASATHLLTAGEAASLALAIRHLGGTAVDAGPFAHSGVFPGWTPRNAATMTRKLFALAGVSAGEVEVSLTEPTREDVDLDAPLFVTTVVVPQVPAGRSPLRERSFRLVRQWLFEQPQARVSQVRFTPDGQRFVACDGEHPIVRRRDSGEVVRRFAEVSNSHATALSSDGRFVAFGIHGGLRVHELESGTCLFSHARPPSDRSYGVYHRDGVDSVDFSPDDRLVASGSDGQLLVHRLADGGSMARTAGNTTGVRVQFWDQTSMLVADAAHLVQRRLDEALPQRIIHGHGIHGLRFYPKVGLVLGCGLGGVFTWDVKSGKARSAIRAPAWAAALVDSEHVAFVPNDGGPSRVILWRFGASAPLAECRTAEDSSSMVTVHSLDVSLAGDALLVANHRGVHELALTFKA
jgi:WD40 repeat protein